MQARVLKRSHIVPRKAGIREIFVPDPSEYTSVENKEKSAVGPPNQGRAQAPYSALSFCLLGKK